MTESTKIRKGGLEKPEKVLGKQVRKGEAEVERGKIDSQENGAKKKG